MQINEYLQIAKKYDKKDKIILGYQNGEKVYFAVLSDFITDRVYFKRSSDKNGVGMVLALKPLTKKHIKMLEQNSTFLCNTSDFMIGYNKGDSFERHIRNFFGVPHAHDNLPFFKGCDMVVNGIGYSIKWHNAQLYSIKTLDRLENN